MKVLADSRGGRGGHGADDRSGRRRSARGRPERSTSSSTRRRTSCRIPGSAEAADNVGDVLTFANDVFDRRDKTVVGHDQGYCVRIVVGESWECTWTTFLADGQITVAGPFYDTRESRLAITGGTGRYADASGWMELRAREGGTKFDFVFRLSR